MNTLVALLAPVSRRLPERLPAPLSRTADKTEEPIRLRVPAVRGETQGGKFLRALLCALSSWAA